MTEESTSVELIDVVKKLVPGADILRSVSEASTIPRELLVV